MTQYLNITKDGLVGNILEFNDPPEDNEFVLNPDNAFSIGDGYFNGALIKKPFGSSVWDGEKFVTPKSFTVSKTIIDADSTDYAVVTVIDDPDIDITVNIAGEDAIFHTDSRGLAEFNLTSANEDLIQIAFGDKILEVAAYD